MFSSLYSTWQWVAHYTSPQLDSNARQNHLVMLHAPQMDLNYLHSALSARRLSEETYAYCLLAFLRVHTAAAAARGERTHAAIFFSLLSGRPYCSWVRGAQKAESSALTTNSILGYTHTYTYILLLLYYYIQKVCSATIIYPRRPMPTRKQHSKMPLAKSNSGTCCRSIQFIGMFN